MVQYVLDGHRKLVKGYADKGASEQLGAKLERAKARGEQGLIDLYKEHRNRALIEHVDDWIAELKQLGRADMYVGPCRARMLRLIDECGWRVMGDISGGAFAKWRKTAKANADHNRGDQTTRTIRNLSPKAKNHYLATLNAFCRWCVKRKRMAANPVGTSDVEKLDETSDVRRERRALTADELHRLLEVVPDHYRLAYQMLMATGLRRAELLALRWGDIHLSPPHPLIQLRAATTKSKRADVLPLRQDLAEVLRGRKADSEDGDQVVLMLPRVPTHRKYLAASGIDWQDYAGRRADIHCPRHSYGTMLAKSGVSVREAMELMRHTDLRLTTKVYTDSRVFDLAGAVERLPIELVNQKQCDTNMAAADQKGIDMKPTRRNGKQCGHGAVWRSKSVSTTTAQLGMCSALTGRDDGEYGLAVSAGPGSLWHQKTPSGGDGEKERAMGFEPTTSALGRLHSTTELRPLSKSFIYKYL